MLASRNILYAPAFLGTAAIAAIALSTLGIAAFTGLIPGSVAHQDAYDVAAGGIAPLVAGDPRCANCGVIEQIHASLAPSVAGIGARGDVAFAGNSVATGEEREARYRITVRMQDGGARILTGAAPPAAAVGARVRVSGNGSLVPDRSNRE
jgi:hypothetical protein